MTDEPLSAAGSDTASGSNRTAAVTAPARAPGFPRKASPRLLKVGVPVLSVLVGAAGVVATVVMQRQQMALQAALKRSETINSRREVYVAFIQALEVVSRQVV